MYNVKIEGRENVPKSSKIIYAANHVSYLDPPMVSLATWKYIAYMAKQELFKDDNKLLRFLVHSLGAFAVNREKPEIATFKTVRDIFKTRWALGVFPQGGTRPYGKLDGIKRGFAVIAQNAKADIVPVAIADFNGYPKLFPFTRRKVSLHICKPISYKLSADEIAYRWCEEISKHADYENCYPKPEEIKEDNAVSV
jgi:1-acyl-sn-glycerol-3-phosphate acyltransferase